MQSRVLRSLPTTVIYCCFLSFLAFCRPLNATCNSHLAQPRQVQRGCRPTCAAGKRTSAETRIARPGRASYKKCVTSNTITIRLGRPKAEIEAAAKPNVNAWVNRLIEQALGPRRLDWDEHFDRKSRQRRFRHRAGEMRRER